MLCFQIFIVLFIFGFCVAETSIDNHPSWRFIPTETCGRRKSQVIPRIVGGKKAFLGEFPSMARMGREHKTAVGRFVKFTCGGTLISKFYVLTAAHCDTSNNIVRLGQNSEITKNNCDQNGCAPSPVDIKVERYFRHNFSETSFVNDILLVQLEKSAEFDEFTMPACLPRGEMFNLNLVGKEVITAGWGIVSNTKRISSPDLRFAIVPVLENDECDKMFVTETLAERQICAGSKRGPDSCGGDSGGPLLKTSENGPEQRTYIMGIISYGSRKCGRGPAVYTRVSFYMNWILDNITK